MIFCTDIMNIIMNFKRQLDWGEINDQIKNIWKYYQIQRCLFCSEGNSTYMLLIRECNTSKIVPISDGMCSELDFLSAMCPHCFDGVQHTVMIYCTETPSIDDFIW